MIKINQQIGSKAEELKKQDQPKKKLMFMVNTEGKTPEQMKKDSWEVFQKFNNTNREEKS